MLQKIRAELGLNSRSLLLEHEAHGPQDTEFGGTVVIDPLMTVSTVQPKKMKESTTGCMLFMVVLLDMFLKHLHGGCGNCVLPFSVLHLEFNVDSLKFTVKRATRQHHCFGTGSGCCRGNRVGIMGARGTFLRAGLLDQRTQA